MKSRKQKGSAGSTPARFIGKYWPKGYPPYHQGDWLGLPLQRVPNINTPEVIPHNRNRRNFPNSLNETRDTLISKEYKDSTWKEIYRSVLLMDIDVKIFNKILAN